MKTLLFLLLISISSFSQEEELAFDYSILKKAPEQFDRNKLKLSGIITELEEHTRKDNLKYFKFKLSKTSAAKQYLQAYYFVNYANQPFPHPELKEKQVLQVEGEFRRNYELSDTKKLGDLYINKTAFEKLRAANINQQKSSNYIIQEDVNKTFSTIYEMGLDYTGNQKPPIVNVQGYITSVQYKEEQNGDAYWIMGLKDHLKSDAKGWSDTSIYVKYYVFLRGTRFADINMDDFFVEDQKVTFRGRYIHKPKVEVNKLVGTIEMNYLDENQEYQDFFVGFFKKDERKNVAVISSANNDQQIRQNIREGVYDKKNVGIEEDDF